MDKDEILSEIRRQAAANGGQPLGRQRFEAATGIRESDWSGRFWVRWSDAVREAGLAPNVLQSKYEDDQVLAALAGLVRDLGHYPVEAELRMRGRDDPAFPSHGTFHRLGRKPEQARRLVDYCTRTPGLDDVRAIAAPLAAPEAPPEDAHGPEGTESLAGFVYLMKSGKFHKLGRSNSVGRRAYELAIQLPEALEVVHTIETDDAPGIEAYWHRRFASRRANGEWFALTPADVRAFKRRRKFM